MSRKRTLSYLGSLAVLVFPTWAWAHAGTHFELSFWSGLIHPLTGLDHALAMIAVGMFAAHLGGRAVWAVPASFLTAMIAGGALHVIGLPLPMVEPGIAASVLVLGLLIALQTKMTLPAATTIVAVFAVFHGYAHGSEMQAGSELVAYIAGFVGATALLHAVGLALGLGVTNLSPRQAQGVLRVGGGCLATVGLLLAGSTI